MKPYRLYWHHGTKIRKFNRRSKRLGVIPHAYDTFNEALEQVKKLWNNDPNTQYLIIDYTTQGNGKIVAINMPEIVNQYEEDRNWYDYLKDEYL